MYKCGSDCKVQFAVLVVPGSAAVLVALESLTQVDYSCSRTTATKTRTFHSCLELKVDEFMADNRMEY